MIIESGRQFPCHFGVVAGPARVAAADIEPTIAQTRRPGAGSDQISTPTGFDRASTTQALTPARAAPSPPSPQPPCPSPSTAPSGAAARRGPRPRGARRAGRACGSTLRRRRAWTAPCGSGPSAGRARPSPRGSGPRRWCSPTRCGRGTSSTTRPWRRSWRPWTVLATWPCGSPPRPGSATRACCSGAARWTRRRRTWTRRRKSTGRRSRRACGWPCAASTCGGRCGGCCYAYS